MDIDAKSKPSSLLLSFSFAPFVSSEPEVKMYAFVHVITADDRINSYCLLLEATSGGMMKVTYYCVLLCTLWATEVKSRKCGNGKCVTTKLWGGEELQNEDRRPRCTKV